MNSDAIAVKRNKRFCQDASNSKEKRISSTTKAGARLYLKGLFEKEHSVDASEM